LKKIRNRRLRQIVMNCKGMQRKVCSAILKLAHRQTHFVRADGWLVNRDWRSPNLIFWLRISDEIRLWHVF